MKLLDYLNENDMWGKPVTRTDWDTLCYVTFYFKTKSDKIYGKDEDGMLFGLLADHDEDWQVCIKSKVRKYLWAHDNEHGDYYIQAPFLTEDEIKKFTGPVKHIKTQVDDNGNIFIEVED